MPYLRFSIVIPAFNEESRLPATLDRVLADLPERASSEIVVVDDGSTDKTADVVLRYRQNFSRIKLVRLMENTGKGAAVRRGMLLARGEVVVVTDADINAAFSQHARLVDAIRAGADIAIASRYSEPIETHDTPLSRRLGSRFFRGMFSNVLGLEYKDTQCGLKAFTRAAARSLLPYQTLNRWCWDAELLLIANRLGFAVSEVPVSFTHDYGSSKFHPVRDGLRSLREVLQIALRDHRGLYPAPASAQADSVLLHMPAVPRSEKKAA